ncbi:hypothetical protein [Streptomyces sp. NPDC048411]|uniref:hypothetical protein n=1 Tax=Streptomyces sp. NPDC048411 TaxID=3157206 RepID=UPI003451245B
MKPGHCSRAVRAAMFAAVCVLLAAVGHVLMSGTTVPWWALLPAFAGTAAAAWALAGRERGLLTVTAATVAVQAVLHSLFSLAQSVVQPSLPAGDSFARQWAAHLTCGLGSEGELSAEEALRIVENAGLGRLVSQPPPGTAATDALGGHAMHHMGSSPTGVVTPGAGHDMAAMSPTGMLAAHLLAAVLCGLWLAYAEQGFFRCLRVLAGWLRAPLRVLFGLFVPVTDRPRVRVRRDFGARRPRRLLLVHAITSRGPPTGTAVL